ncbi:MAG: hypothetical protein KBC95_00280 [Candidatus Peribacteraceae bacterium]|jgi:hypothetical protein|nr:hypothetical protein [Candidatus Peribacteraceae bacterium]
MQKLWFRAKRYGYGWTPATWEGWLVTLAAIALYLLPSAVLTAWYPDNLPPTALIGFFAWMTVVSVVLIWIAAKTGEPARWRWGN